MYAAVAGTCPSAIRGIAVAADEAKLNTQSQEK
jgi:hypothetical protein